MYRLLLALVAVSLLSGLAQISGKGVEAAQPMWQKFVPRKQVEADPERDYTLAKEHGPWLILAATFSGSEAEGQARELILELRREYRLPAFYYGMTFQLDETDLGRGIDVHGSRIRRHYQRGSQIREHAVLVGEFPSVDDADARRLLQQIKQLAPTTLVPEEGKATAQSLASVRQFHSFLRKKIGASNKKGPMGHAFLTRNPLLPKEYFVSQGVEEDVAKWNEGLDFSLLKCPGKYSVRVATFRGRTSLQAAQGKETSSEKAKSRTRRATSNDPLVIAGKKANKLAIALREKGWEAYEFHDRYESYVTIGSFDEGQARPDGQIALKSRDAQIIIRTFGATSPNNIFNRPAPQDQMVEQRQKQRFMNMFESSMGQVAEGFHPKRFVGIPFDIYPKPVRVPRRSISSAYVRK